MGKVVLVSVLMSAVAASSPSTFSTAGEAFLFAGEEGPQNMDYKKAVPLLLAAWEDVHGRIQPGPTGKVVMKIYTNSGLGLRTPQGLVLALAEALEERGFKRENLVIADLDRRRLRSSGYLPPLSEGGDRFHGMPVIALDDPAKHLEDWFYESPLPPDPLLGVGETETSRELLEGDEDRKSFLPAPLLFDLDFWINLPVAVEHPVLGISGALANAGVWSVSNQSRFFSRPVSAASSAVEIAAIPELQRTWLFSILSLETFQFIGGPRFNAHYTESRPELLLSADPLLLDRYALAVLNGSRLERNFEPITPEPLFFRYGESLDLGDADLDPVRIRIVEAVE